MKRLARQEGAVALEALASLILMFVALYLMWGAAVVVYDQSKVITGVQAASQGALVVYDRLTYRGGYPPGSGSDGGAYDNARIAAYALLYWNSEGLLADPFGNRPLSPALSVIDVTCGSSITGVGGSAPQFGGGSCKYGDASSAAVTRVEVDANDLAFFAFINPYLGKLGSDPRKNPPHQQLGRSLNNNFGQCIEHGAVVCASAISAGPGATP